MFNHTLKPQQMFNPSLYQPGSVGILPSGNRSFWDKLISLSPLIVNAFFVAAFVYVLYIYSCYESCCLGLQVVRRLTRNGDVRISHSAICLVWNMDWCSTRYNTYSRTHVYICTENVYTLSTLHALYTGWSLWNFSLCSSIRSKASPLQRFKE